MEKPIRPVFSFEINYEFLPGIITIGKYDGTHPCLTVATTDDKVLIHSPHKRIGGSSTGNITITESNKEVSTLNINQAVTALVAGKIIPSENKDVLLIGTNTHLLAYNVHDNKDVFYQDCPDSVKTIRFGTMSDPSKPVIFVGGNSTVRGFDHTGLEVYWLAIGDTVTSILLLDFNRDGFNEIMVCTEDYTIKVYKDSKMIAESLETGVVTILTALPESRFSYALSNGTIGVYELDVRLWRVKSKNNVISSFGYDLLAQGTVQLITGWSNGKLDCRSIKTGEILFKDVLEHGIAGIVEADYRSNGKSDLIVATVNGTVKGFSTTKPAAIMYTVEQQEEAIKELVAEKQKLLEEMKSNETLKIKNGDRVYLEDDLISSGIIPANTKLTAIISNEDPNKHHLELILMTNNLIIIKAAIIFAEGFFNDDVLTVNPPPSKLSSLLVVPLELPKDIAGTFLIKALVGYPASEKFHVFEFVRQIPRFSMYCKLDDELDTLPKGFVEFEIHERLQRICMWINQNFMFSPEIEFDGKPKLCVNFKCLRDEGFLQLCFENNGKHRIYVESVSLASDLIQSLASFCKLDVLKSTAHFPKEEEKLLKLMKELEEIQRSKVKLNADVAQKLGEARTLLIRAEDSRINSVMDMGKYYYDLTLLNKELINGHNIRVKNHQEGMTAMKTINIIIQKASRLRVGQDAAHVINDCKVAIQNNDMDGLIRVIRYGTK